MGEELSKSGSKSTGGVLGEENIADAFEEINKEFFMN
jgi:hypothetical protein